MTEGRQIHQRRCPEIASPAEIARARLQDLSFRAGDLAETQRGVLLTIARLLDPEIRWDMEGRPLSVVDQEELRERVAQGYDEPTTVYDAEGRPAFIGSYNNGEY